MKILSNLLALSMLALVVSGCSKSEDESSNGAEGLNEIKLSSRVSLLKSSLQNVQIENGQKVGFTVLENVSRDALYENVELTASGTGSFTTLTKMYYPTNGNNVDFYAYHPYNSTQANGSTGKLSFSVKAGQNSQTDYLLSDVLYGEKLNVTRTNNVVPMTFFHKMSKLSFTIVKGDGVDISKLNNIKVLNILPDVEMDLSNGTISEAKGTPITVTAFNVTGAEADAEQVEGASAIVVPQKIAASTGLLSISVDKVTFTYKTENEITFESGKNYNFVITVSMGGIVVESTITDWGDGGSINGGGVMD
ncbi:MAG: fimbrillin family protein [Dysgonomonas sp.]